jgi:uncharacterized membrane protein
MSSYDLVVFVHVVAAVVLVGGGLLATPTVNAAIRQAPTIPELRRWLTVGKPLGRVNPISSVTLLATGIYLASIGDWWGAPWVQVAVGLWVANSVLASTLLKPSMGAIARLAIDAEGEQIGPQLDAARRSPRLAVTEDVMLASDLGVLFLMVVKPAGYFAALLVVVMAQLALFGTRTLRHLASTRSTGRASPAAR